MDSYMWSQCWGCIRDAPAPLCWLKKYSHNLKVESYFICRMFRTPSQGDSISVALRKLLQGGRGKVWLYLSLLQREQAVWTSNIRYQVKEFSILYGKMQSSQNPFLSYASAIWGQILFPCLPCFLQSPWRRWEWAGWQHPLDHSLGSSHSHLKARNH